MKVKDLYIALKDLVETGNEDLNVRCDNEIVSFPIGMVKINDEYCSLCDKWNDELDDEEIIFRE